MTKKKDGPDLRSHAVCSVEIATGSTIRYDSMQKAANAMMVSNSHIKKCAEQIKPMNGFVWCHEKDLEEAKKRAAALKYSDRMQTHEIKYKDLKNDGMVWLSLDANTRIRVRPEEATPEFAERYRQKINKAHYGVQLQSVEIQ